MSGWLTEREFDILQRLTERRYLNNGKLDEQDAQLYNELTARVPESAVQIRRGIDLRVLVCSGETTD